MGRPLISAFKFMPSKYANDFVSGRSIRIGTLSDFRKTEVHQLNKGDPLEGLLKIKGPGGWESDLPDNRALLLALRRRGLIVERSHLTGIEADVMLQEREHYVFCAARSFDANVASDLDLSYDCCIQIFDMISFAEAVRDALQEALSENFLPVTLGFVSYEPRIILPSADRIDTGVFYKEPRFLSQNEIRVAIPSPTPNASPLNLKIDMRLIRTRVKLFR
jgi:hypothetical protein